MNAGDWIPVKMPTEETFALWWVVPKTVADEHYTDTSGTPILAPPSKGRMAIGRLGCWSSLEKPTHWMPLPPPPTTVDKP